MPRVASHGEPLRLLWLIDSLTVGGAESLAVSFAREARARGIELTMCARTSIDGNALAAEAGEVVTLDARRLFDVAAFRRLLRLMRDQRINLIHAHLTYASLWGAMASRITRVPMIATLHLPPADGGIRERVRQRMLRSALNRWAARVVVVSEALRETWASRLKRMVVVHNGISECGGSAAAFESGGRATALQKVLTVAVLREGKGIDVLIEAARKVPNAEFVIAGDGPMREEWTRKAAGLPITFLGHRRDVPELMRSATLFVLPTLADAFPTVLLEALEAGLPIVASDVGGVPEIVDSRMAILVPPNNANALAEAINRALDDEAWRKNAAIAAKKRFEAQFSIARWIDRLMRLYDEVRE